MIWNLEMSQTGANDFDNRTYRQERNIAKAQKHTEREESRKRQAAAREKEIRPGAKTRKGAPMVRGRFPVPMEYVKKHPLGYPENLAAKEMCVELFITRMSGLPCS